MEYVYAAMLLHKAGKEINEEALTNILQAAGITVESTRVKALVASLNDINIEEAIKSGPRMMTAPAEVQAQTTPAKEVKPKEEEKKKAEDEKAKEDAALEGLGALFG